VYNEITLMERIEAVTNYSIFYSPGRNIDLLNPAELLDKPRLYVGHIGIKRMRQQDFWSDGYTDLESDQILLTEINYICDRLQWKEVRENIRTAYLGWSPFPNNSDVSSVTFVEALFKGGTEDRVWWAEVVGLIYPKIQ
jgi:hypothetical protein